MAPFLSVPSRAVVRAPKIAVPTRTIVAPSSIATSKSWLMPIDSSRSAPAGTPACNQPVAQLAQPGETTAARPPGFRPAAAAASSPRARAAVQSCGRRDDRRHRRRPARRVWCLRAPGPPGSAHRPSARLRLRASSTRRSRSTLSIAWIAVDRGRGFPRLVRLQVADQVPPNLHVGRCAIFCRASWTLFSPKSRCPASAAARTASIGIGLGDGDQPDVARLAPGAAGRVRDALANLRQPFAECARTDLR